VTPGDLKDPNLFRLNRIFKTLNARIAKAITDGSALVASLTVRVTAIESARSAAAAGVSALFFDIPFNISQTYTVDLKNSLTQRITISGPTDTGSSQNVASLQPPIFTGGTVAFGNRFTLIVDKVGKVQLTFTNGALVNGFASDVTSSLIPPLTITATRSFLEFVFLPVSTTGEWFLVNPVKNSTPS